MDLFGRKKKRAEAAANEEKILLKVKEEYKVIKDRVNTLYETSRKNQEETEEHVNNTCPKCKSKNVNDRIQRLQGEFSGSISGSRSLFSGSLYGHSSGKIDTNEVNKCNDCGHEWKKYKASVLWYSDTMELQFQHLIWLLGDYKEVKTATVDKYDLDENYTSDDQKRSDLLNKMVDGYRFKTVSQFFTGISIEAIKIIALKEVWKQEHSSDYYVREIEKHWDEKFLEDYLKLKHIQI